MTLLEKAIRFAVEMHTGVMRKRENLPYILHPLEAAVIVGTMTDDEEVLAAAVLHDTVEDTGATLEQLAEQFGKRVAALVASETEDKRPQLSPGESWRTRKEESLAYLKNAADPGVKLIWLGDKLSNMRSFLREWKRSGNAMWESFNQKDPAQQAWYYRSGAALLAELKDYEAWQEYSALVDAVFAELP